MSNINVDVTRMESDTQRLAALSSTLADIKQSLRSTKSGILSCSLASSIRLVCNDIDTCVSRIGRQVDKNNSLASSLYDIIEVYRSKELGCLDLGASCRDISASDITGSGSVAGGTGTGAESESDRSTSVRLEDMTYEEALEYRRQNAVDENSRLLYERYLNRVNIHDDDYDDGAHYNTFWNHINYNADDDSTNRRGVGNTYYHEVGHLIDDRSDWFGSTSNDNSYDLYGALENDLNNYLDRIMAENGYTSRDDAYDHLSNWLNSDPNMMNGISDLVCGLTNGQASGQWLHAMSYYNHDSIENEAFAHFFEASMRCDSVKLDYIRELFPEAYEEYQRMITDILN